MEVISYDDATCDEDVPDDNSLDAFYNAIGNQLLYCPQLHTITHTKFQDNLLSQGSCRKGIVGADEISTPIYT